MENELNSREAQLQRLLEEKKVAKQESSTLVGEAKREVDQCKDSYDILVADDKTLDKTFRREFMDQDQHTVDVLYRLFKRRPRLSSLSFFPDDFYLPDSNPPPSNYYSAALPAALPSLGSSVQVNPYLQGI